MEGYGGPAQPSPTIGQCLNGGLGWLEIECNRCDARASLPTDAIRRPRGTRSSGRRNGGDALGSSAVSNQPPAAYLRKSSISKHAVVKFLMPSLMVTPVNL